MERGAVVHAIGKGVYHSDGRGWHGGGGGGRGRGVVLVVVVRDWGTVRSGEVDGGHGDTVAFAVVVVQNPQATEAPPLCIL